MNEHPTHDGLASEPDPAELARIELASAYVDGDVDATQRAQVEASPQLMGLVASLQQVRTEVADVPPIDLLARQRAVAAALAEFDLVRATPVPNIAAPPRVVPFPTRNRWSRVLTAAAAVLLIGVIGIAAVNGMQGTDSKSSSGAPTGALAPQSHADSASGTVAAGGTTTAAAAAGTDTGKSSTEATIGTIGAPASARVEVDTPAQLLSVSDQYAVTGTGTGTAGAGTEPSTSIASAVVSTTVPPKYPAGTDNAGSQVDPPVSAASRSDRPSLPCSLNSHQEVIALITFKGVDAAAVLDTSTGEISAIDAQCHVLATARR